MPTHIINDKGSVTSPKGFSASGIKAGLKASGAPDMALIFSNRPCHVAAAFTANLFAAAPVIYDRDIIAAGNDVQAVVINSGTANACTGERGIRDARSTALITAQRLGINPEQVLVASTGHIGDFLPMDIITRGINLAAEFLSRNGGKDAAHAIMTTDTRPKAFSVEIEVAGTIVTLGGMTKGAGMIAPKLIPARPPQATMLSFITTDACIAPDALREALADAVDNSFNRITVDGDTSTNDTFIVLANANAGNPEIKPGTPELQLFTDALTALAGKLAREMVRDGEGVSRFVEINVTGAKSITDARVCAEAIANSSLCKTAWFGADPNWGRILCAAGYSGIAFDPARVNLDIQSIPVVRNGMDAGTPPDTLAECVKAPELKIDLNLNAGPGAFTVWSCDLTYDYVKINADYRT